MADVETGGGGAVSGDVHSRDFAGRDGGQRVIVNNYDEPRMTPQPKTLWQAVNEISAKVDKIYDLIQGNEEDDIRGMRPRIREIEQRVQVILVVLAIYLVPLIYMIVRLIF